MANKSKNPDPVTPNLPGAASGGGIVPDLAGDAFGGAAPGQEGAILDQQLNATSTGSASGNALWDTSQTTVIPRVYWGSVEDRPDASFMGPVKSKDKTLTLQDSVNQSSLWSPAFRQGIALKMYRAGLITDPTNWNSVSSAWANVVQEAGMRYAMSGGKSKVTPYDMLDLMVGVSADGGKQKATSTTKTTHSTKLNANVIDADTADSLVRAIYHDQLGRDPSSNELNTYRTLVTGYSKSHPTKIDTTTTTTSDGNQQTDSDGNVVSDGDTTSTTKSTNSGGWTQDGMNNVVKNKVEADPEYGAYQAATTYYNALQDLIANGH